MAVLEWPGLCKNNLGFVKDNRNRARMGRAVSTAKAVIGWQGVCDKS